jgi:hypothetical protein
MQEREPNTGAAQRVTIPTPDLICDAALPATYIVAHARGLHSGRRLHRHVGA